jgi:hypothetical protein
MKGNRKLSFSEESRANIIHAQKNKTKEHIAKIVEAIVSTKGKAVVGLKGPS